MWALGVVYSARSGPGPAGRVVGIVLAALGVVLVGWASAPALRLRRLRRATTATTGHVVEVRQVGRVLGVILCAPVVAFDVGGRPIAFVGQGRGKGRRWVVGEAVEVLFDPVAPEVAYTVDIGTLRWVLGSVGAVLLVFGVVLAVR